MVSVTGFHTHLVVGLNASATSRQAVLWAAEEAKLRRLSLIITHVASTAGSAALRQADHDGLSAAATVASQREPAIAVGTQLLTGDVAEVMIQLSHSAALIVVGLARHQPRPAHILTAPEDGRVTPAECPVVTISPRLTLSDASHAHVVVGWTRAGRQDQVLEAAAVEASVRVATLTVVVDAPDGSRSSEPSASAAAALLRVDVATLARAHPQLRITVQEASPDLARDLQRRSAGADLLVLGWEKFPDRWSINFGQPSDLMTETADCPVMLVPTAAGAKRHLPPAA